MSRDISTPNIHCYCFTSELEKPNQDILKVNENNDLEDLKSLKRKQGRKKKAGKNFLPENFTPSRDQLLFKKEFEGLLEELAQFVNSKLNNGYEFFESELKDGFKSIIKEFYDLKEMELTEEKLNFLYQIGRKAINKIYANKRHEIVKFWSYYFFLFSPMPNVEELIDSLSSKNVPGRIIIYALLVVLFFYIYLLT